MASQTGSPGLTAPSAYQALPGVPPNMSVLAAMSAGLIPANALTTNYGTRDSRPGRTVLEAQGAGAGNGVGVGVANANVYAWPNAGACGGQSLGAGGLNQVDGPGGGEACILIAAAPASVPTIPAQPVFQG